ncbi:hypothetical protein EW146_g1188 [Bondarzewia mesenterica]|uniref:REM-1 domain-containing protein n=1 Tax=Bondarzewia mesenterica TaxID=1095465 RepID=A0A4S4M4H0_9AGAM|nr:hypothetical protein EW146_g1188 [Bondarzewia mesenterica]
MSTLVDGSFEIAASSILSGTTVTTLVNGGVSNDANRCFDFSELEGKDVGRQSSILNNMMANAVAIKEGAENILNQQHQDMKDTFRVQLESELQIAERRIGTITHRMELLRRSVDDKDDFRTVLHQASGHVKTLLSSGRSFSTTPTSPSSSSSPASPLFSEEEVNCTRIGAMTKLIDIFKQHLRVRYELDVAQVVQAVIPSLSDRSSQFCRATAYRLLRHTIVNKESVERLKEQPLDWYIVKSLTLDNKHSVEKEQVIKLIRAIVEIGSQRSSPHTTPCSGNVPLSDPVMRAFIAIAEHPDDPFKFICVQTLAEIMLIDIELVARTGGIRVLLQMLADGPTEIAQLLTPVFLYIVDSPRTRSYLRAGTDLEMALSGVTDAYGKDPSDMDNMRAIRALIDTLRIPSLETREVVLDMFFDLLNIKTPHWYQTFINGRRLTMYHKPRPSSGPDQNAEKDMQRMPEPLKLTDQYISLLVLVFTQAGLLDALMSMLEETTTGNNLTRKATLLMAEILQLANKILPLSVAARLQLIPRVFNLASDYDHGEHRIVGTSALSSLDSLNRNRLRLQPTVVTSNRPRANSVEDAIRRGQRHVEQVKIKMGLQMDDKTFQAALLETQVMLTKDHSKWNFETLQDLIEGPLLNPKRMEEAIKVSRFIRRLMSFYHPFSHRFSDIERTKANLRWVRLGCTLLTTLMASSDGQRFLSSEDDFMKQIVRSFAQLDPKHKEGIEFVFGLIIEWYIIEQSPARLMEKFKVFTAFYHLSELRSREDLIKGIIENIDYSMDGHPRIVLSKALTSSYKHIRLYATNHLGMMIRSSTTANSWILRLLITQLYDPNREVCEMAAHFLEEACESMENLQLVVVMQPTLDHLDEIGHGLLLKFMSTPMGFRYLYDAGYIDREMEKWLNDRNNHYVVQIEVFLAKAFNFIPHDEEDMLTFDGMVPPHFYGEMAKTELGCQVLHEKGHFADFAHFIRQHGLENEDPEVILKLKSILWTAGNIGSSAGGLPFLEEEEIIPVILDIAEQSLVLSVRGTCFFVLGLISTTPQGAEILDDYRWEATLSPLGFPTGLCIPMDVDKFISIPPWEPTPVGNDSVNHLVPPTSQAEEEVVTAISNLSNAVIANTASRSLAKLKSRPEYRKVFSSLSMFYRGLHMISTSRYRLPVRRFIFDLFDIELNYDVVKQLAEYARVLRASPSKAAKPVRSSRVVSVLFPVHRADASESDEEEEGSNVHRPKADAPVMSLRPRSMIVGFEDQRTS